jgi:carboxyl-terminal processing protease
MGMVMKKKYQIALLILSIVIVTYSGLKVNNYLLANEEKNIKVENEQKFLQSLNYISNFYVDEVDWDKSFQGAINGFLSNLDPHSIYISPSEVEINEENNTGKYQGIGIQFDILDGYLTVIAPISGSPSEKLGLMAGDKIIKINGENSVGLTTAEVQKKLKGEKDTSVDITILRKGVDKELEFTIVRDEIPINTVFTSFLNEEKTGYIFLTRFSKTTEEEIEQALGNLEDQGMEKLILDLRWNPGGFLDQAVRVVGKFINGHKRVVYTRGRLSQFDEDYYTDSFGESVVRNYPIIVLINHASASASEIVAGAIQDYDRGLIVGKTSFGKGLVQREFPLKDNSRLRLTISKYYTPSGRLIQRPYENTSLADYYTANLDSIYRESETDSLGQNEFHTSNGRNVFGGGGIKPDVTVEYTSASKSQRLTQQLHQHRIFFEVAAEYANNNSHLSKDYEKFLSGFKITKNLLNRVKIAAKKKQIEINDEEFTKDLDYIQVRLKAELARSLWDNTKYYQVIMVNDNQFQEAMSLFPKADKIIAGLH